MSFGSTQSAPVKSTTTSTQELSPEQRQLLNIALPIATQFGQNPPKLFPGSTIAPQNQLQTTAQQMMLQTAGSALPTVAGAGGEAAQRLLGGQLFSSATPQVGQTLAAGGPQVAEDPRVSQTIGQLINGTSGGTNFQDLGQSLVSMLSPQGQLTPEQARMLTQRSDPTINAAQNFLLGPVMSPETNPALRSAIDAAVRPLSEQFTQTVLPNIRQGAITAGQFGGSRQGVAEDAASRDFLRQVGDTSASLSNEAFKANLGALVQGFGTAANREANQAQTMVQLLNNEIQRKGIDVNAVTQTVGNLLQSQAAQESIRTGALTTTMQSLLQSEATRLGISTDAMTNAFATMMNSETQRGGIEANAAIGTIANFPDLLNAMMLPAQAVEAVGTQQQQQQQALLSEQAQRFMAEQLLPFSVAQDIAALAFGIPGGSTTTTSTAQQGKQQQSTLQTVGQVAGTLASIAAIFAV